MTKTAEKPYPRKEVALPLRVTYKVVPFKELWDRCDKSLPL